MRFAMILAATAAALPLGAASADGPAPGAPPGPAEIAAMRARGQQVWTETCAACHDNATGRTPTRAFLTQTRSPDYIYRALTAGVMKDVTAAVSIADKKAVATFLIGNPPGGASEIKIDANPCKHPGPAMTLAGSTWNGWGGAGVNNARYQANPGFTAAEVSRLKLKWAFAFPGGVSNEPAVVGGRVFVSSMTGVTFALDAKTGCTYWSKDLGVPSRTMITVGKLPSGRFAAYVTTWQGKVLALDAVTGKQIWETTADDHRAVRLTGSPTLHAGRLYVPVSSGEEGLASDPKYVCCTFRGSLVALNAATGKQLWKSYTIDKPAAPIPGDGHRFGPSGAALWMAPTIDVKRKLIYVASGDDYTLATDASDAIIAFDLVTGAKRWVKQVLPGDVFVGGCTATSRTVNCPKEGEVGPDFDFGASPVLAQTSTGKEVLVAVSKAGIAFGFDPDAKGKILWEAKVGRGGLLGGLEWGIAWDGKLAYVPISDAPYAGKPASGDPSFPVSPGLNAIDPATGTVVWRTPAPVVKCSFESVFCTPAFAGASAAIPGAVFSGAWDGYIRAFDSATGAQLWDFNTARSFKAVNGATANGGSVDHGGQTIAAGMVLVTSGGRQAQPGNLMLVFSVDGK